MDTVDVAAVTKIVKMVGAEFKEVSDDDIGFWIELQAPVISRKKFGKLFADLDEDQQKAVQQIYPQKISEAEPKNYGDKK